MLSFIFSTIAIGLQIFVTFYHWFVSSFHPLTFIGIITFLACIVYLCGLNKFVINLFHNFNIVLPKNKTYLFNSIYLAKFAIVFFLGAYIFELAKWIVISLQHLTEAMVIASESIKLRAPLNIGIFFKPFTAKENFWLFPTAVIGFIIEFIIEGLSTYQKKMLGIDEETNKNINRFEKYLWKTVFGMGFTIYFFSSLFFLVMTRINKNFSVSLDDRVFENVTNIFKTNAWTTLKIASPIFLFSILWEPFLNFTNFKGVIFIIVVSFPCFFLVVESVFSLENKYPKFRNRFIKALFSISMISGAILLINDPISFPLFNFFDKNILTNINLPFTEKVLPFFSILFAILFCFWAFLIWRNYSFESLRTNDPFLNLYKEKVDLFTFSIVLRFLFFGASFYSIKDELLGMAMEKALLGLAMMMPLTSVGYKLDEPILEIKNNYTKQVIKSSYHSHRIKLEKFLNTRFFVDVVWFVICTPFWFESRLIYNLFLIAIPLILFFYFLTITMETASINANLKVYLKPLYFKQGAANSLSFGMYNKEINKPD